MIIEKLQWVLIPGFIHFQILPLSQADSKPPLSILHPFHQNQILNLPQDYLSREFNATIKSSFDQLIGLYNSRKFREPGRILIPSFFIARSFLISAKSSAVVKCYFSPELYSYLSQLQRNSASQDFPAFRWEPLTLF